MKDIVSHTCSNGFSKVGIGIKCSGELEVGVVWEKGVEGELFEMGGSNSE